MFSAETFPAALHPDIERGLRWTGIRQIVTSLVGAAGVLVYARVLTPDALGAAALALLVYEGLTLLIRAPIQHAIVYFQRDESDHPSAALWLLLIFSLPAALGVLAAAPWLGQFYRSREAAGLTRAITVAFLLMAAGTAPGALLVRHMRFRMYEILGATYQLVIMIGWMALSLAGFGPWSLILPVVAASAVWSSGMWIAAWAALRFRPALRPPRQAFRDIFRFARSVWGSQLLTYLMSKIDNAAVGRLGERALGFYAFGEDQSVFASISVGTVIAQVTLPALARLQDDRRAFGALYLRMLRLIAAAATPMQVGALVIADLGLTLFYGSQWSGAVPVFRAYVAFHLLDVFNDLGDAATSAIGRPDIRLKLNLLQLPFFVAGTWFGLAVWGGIVGVAAALAIVRALGALIYLGVTWRLLRLPLRAVLAALAPSSIAAGVMGLAALGARNVAPPDGWLAVGLSIAAAVPVYGIVLLALDRAGFMDVLRLAVRLVAPETLRQRIGARLGRFRRSAPVQESPPSP